MFEKDGVAIGLYISINYHNSLGESLKVRSFVSDISPSLIDYRPTCICNR